MLSNAVIPEFSHQFFKRNSCLMIGAYSEGSYFYFSNKTDICFFQQTFPRSHLPYDKVHKRYSSVFTDRLSFPLAY